MKLTPVIVMLVLVTTACTSGRDRSGGSADPISSLPPPTHSAEQMAGMFERPTTVAALLRNLKVAVDDNLQAEPGFTTDANLLKFFNGSTVRHEQVGVHGYDFNVQNAFVTITDPAFPQMTVEVEQGLVRIVGRSNTPVRIKRYGAIQMSVAAVPEFTVAAVRAVFGPETVGQIGGDWASDGHFAPRTAKGNLIYRYTDVSVLELSPFEAKQATFVIQSPKRVPHDDTRSSASAWREIYDTDAIDGIYIYVSSP